MTDIEKLYALYGKPFCVRILRDGEFVPCEFFIQYIKLKDFYVVCSLAPCEFLSLISYCTTLSEEQIGNIHPDDFIDLFCECVLLNKNNLFNTESHKQSKAFKLEYMKSKKEVLADMVARASILKRKTFREILNDCSFEELILTFEGNIRSKSIEGAVETATLQQTQIGTSWAKASDKKRVMDKIEKKRIEANEFGLNKS